MSFNIVRTAYNVGLETCKMLGATYTPLLGSTLNEYFRRTVAVSDIDTPVIKYFGLGLRFDDLIVDRGLTAKDISRDPLDILPERPIPFLAVRKSIGLTSTERASYRMIVEEAIGDETYILCYLKEIGSSVNKNGYFDISMVDSNYTAKQRSSVSIDDLNHNPIEKLNLYKDNFKYVGYSHSIAISLTQVEIENIKLAINLLYPNEAGDIDNHIGEVMLVSGVDVKTDSGTEVGMAQSAYFFGVNFALNNLTANEEETNLMNVDLGAMQMLMKELT